MLSSFYFRLIAYFLLCAATQAHALTAEQALAMAAGETDDRVAAVQQAVVEPSDRIEDFLKALAADEVKVAAGKALIVRDDKGVDPVTGAAVPVPADAEDIINNNRMRGEIDTALAGLALFGKDDAKRMAAAKALTREPDVGRLPLLDKALAQETRENIKVQLQLARAATLLGSDDATQRIAAAQALSLSATPDTRLLLNERDTVEEDAKVKAALQAALKAIDGQLAWGERLGAAFSGISLGSILLLVALGLAITYGLMGVINMAHGELMM
ncbi:MAG: urea ABC transporter permease subunit UrtB, partial [Gammaproteobacteria bacterium]|nr:urea ABC transporter permease subunit UrtB [Gammaproteobacteria bacterium]